MKLFNQANRTEYVESDKAMPIIARVGTGGATAALLSALPKNSRIVVPR